MTAPMPQTAEQAHAVARQHYRAMLHHAAAGNEYQTRDSAAFFQNAQMLAVMYEARQARLFLAEILAEVRGGRYAGDDSHELHPAAPKVPHDGFAVGGLRR